jgi:plastocyanin
MVYVKRAKTILKRTNILIAGIFGVLLGTVSSSVLAQDFAVNGQVEISRAAKNGQAPAKADSAANVAVWLTPLENGTEASGRRVTGRIAQLVQKNKKFEPHLLIVEVGSRVEFPNKDPFFHNVFSLFNGKRFDLGLYEAGSSNSVRFDRAGISYLFCNIHPEMSAIVVSVPTPYYGVSNGAGKVAIPMVPGGRYRLHVWSERSSPEDLAKLERDVVISEASHTLEPIHVVESIAPELSHKNMYGKDYVPPASSPGYTHP